MASWRVTEQCVAGAIGPPAMGSIVTTSPKALSDAGDLRRVEWHHFVCTCAVRRVQMRSHSMSRTMLLGAGMEPLHRLFTSAALSDMC